MMHVRTMGYIVDAMEETRGMIPDVAKQAVSRWNGDGDTTKYVRSSNNHVFRFERNGSGCFLRLTPSSERSRRAIEGEVAFVRHLAARNVPVAVPLASASASFIEDIPRDQGPLYAVVFNELTGRQVEFETQGPSMFQAWGRALGELHNASQSFTAGSAGKIKDWTDDVRMAYEWLPKKEDAARRELAEMTGRLESLDTGKEAFGVIHFDFEEDNLFWDGTRFHICDFDCVARYWYMADIAFALHGLRNAPQDKRRNFLKWFLEGYRNVRVLDEYWEKQMSCFVRFCLVFHFAKMCKAYHGADPKDDPAWVAGMRQRHNRWLEKTRKEFEIPFVW